MLTMINLRSRMGTLILTTFLALLLITFFLVTPPFVEATGSYSFLDYAYCSPTGARGSDEFTWYDYNLWDWGSSTAVLWVWSTDTQSWVNMDQKNGFGGGPSGNVFVGTGPRMTGSPHWWTETAGHNASFFSGSQGSGYGPISCNY